MFKLIILGKQRDIRTKRLIFVISSILLLTVAVVFALAIPVSAEPEAVFTGCLNEHSGVLNKVAIGFEPFFTCNPTEVQVTWDRGVPALDLESRIAALEEHIAEIESDLAPLELTVDCSKESVGEALAQAADRTAHVTITVVGVCEEEVVISRDDTTLQGESPGDGFRAPESKSRVLVLRARGIELDQLTLIGGSNGILATDAASFSARGLHISGADNGVYVEKNAVGDLYNSTVENTYIGVSATTGGVLRMFGGTVDTNTAHGLEASFGGYIGLYDGAVVQNSDSVAVHAREGGSIAVSNGTIEDNAFGVFAISGGHVTIQDGSVIQNNEGGGVGTNDGGTVWLSGGVRVADNQGGGVVGRSGTLTFGDVIIENNGDEGISLGGGSTASFGGGTIVRNNEGHGIALGATSSATFFDDTVQVTGNTGTAVICSTSHLDDVALIVGEPGTISGNGSDAIECPRGFP